MPETPSWTPEDSRDISRDRDINGSRRKDSDSSGSIYAINGEDAAHGRAVDKWRQINAEAIHSGQATELPEVADGRTSNIESQWQQPYPSGRRNETYANTLRSQQALDWGAERVKNGDDQYYDHEKANINNQYPPGYRPIDKALEEGRQWATKLQEARAAGVEVPEKFESTKQIMQIERDIYDDKVELDRKRAAIPLLREADQLGDGALIEEIIQQHFSYGEYLLRDVRRHEGDIYTQNPAPIIRLREWLEDLERMIPESERDLNERIAEVVSFADQIGVRSTILHEIGKDKPDWDSAPPYTHAEFPYNQR